MSVAQHLRAMLIHEAVAYEELGRKLLAEKRPSRKDEQTHHELAEMVRAMRVLAAKLK
jgi:hypothetical protein